MIVLFTGDHLRHKYLVDSFSKVFDDLIWIIEKREKYIPNIDKNFNTEIKKLQKTHFEKRQDAENEFFTSKAGDLSKNQISQIFEINQEDFFNGKLKKILMKTNSKFLISYGVHKIPANILKDLKGYKWNVHGGLSPWYRGVITHFWPSYMLEPEYTGSQGMAECPAIELVTQMSPVFLLFICGITAFTFFITALTFRFSMRSIVAASVLSKSPPI